MPSPALQGAPGCRPRERVHDSPAQTETLSPPVLHLAGSWGLHLSTADTSEHGAQGRGQGGLRVRDQELQSPQNQESKTALEQVCGCPQAQWPVSHSLNVPNTSDRVWVLCQTPATPCPPAVRGRLPCVLRPCCVPGHSAPPAISVPWPCSVVPQMTLLAYPAAKAETAPLAQPLWDLS